MTRMVVVVVAVAAALQLGMSSAGHIPDFSVEGQVYCDTCRAGFVTNATLPIEGAKVRLECRHFMSASGTVERSAENATNASGKYRIDLKDNRGSEEVCAVRLISSPMPGCGEVEIGRDRAQVTLDVDDGSASLVRRANPLGFLKTQPLPNCGKILSDLALRASTN